MNAPFLSHETRPLDSFARRHLGSGPVEIEALLKTIGYRSLEELTNKAIPTEIHLNRPLNLPPPRSESEALSELREIAKQNCVFRSYLGQGYNGTITPPVIQRNLLESPGWYTSYTPYQAEISQGRLEALLNFQTLVTDLTGLPIANASLLDEGTAAAEAMHLCYAAKSNGRKRFFVAQDCHPQTINIVKTRALPLGIEVVVGNFQQAQLDDTFFGALVQYPTTYGTIYDYSDFVNKVHSLGGLVVVAADPLSLTLLKPPGEFGADVAVGSMQRFGVPMGFGGPHAAYFATRDEFKRLMPGRLVGVSKDAQGNPAYRLSLQAREQHIRRDKATSNICTAQALLASIASMYACYHGPIGLRQIARRVHTLTKALASGLAKLNYKIGEGTYFDTITVQVGAKRFEEIEKRAIEKKINLRKIDDATFGISLDESVNFVDLQDLWTIFHNGQTVGFDPTDFIAQGNAAESMAPIENRTTSYLTHPIFHRYHTETEMMRYLKRLEARDLSLTTSMIPLGSCTMKLNAAAEMLPITWPEFNQLHPYAPASQTKGYDILCHGLEKWLCEITGFDAVSLQPNAGSQGEYAGLLAIRGYHEARAQGHRDICLIPTSAHGTNPASAALAGYRVVTVQCDKHGNIDLENLKAKAQEHKNNLAALMVTYPSTHGVFETSIQNVADIIHEFGGQVYMDGANMNAQIGLCRPGDYGMDVCHLNLHKTFCIPHGGGGPGVGPICVAKHLTPYIPSHTLEQKEGLQIAAAPYGSANILVISWMFIAMMGSEGLTAATQLAVLNANYIAKRLESHFPVLFKGKTGLVAHECIVDLRGFKATAGVEVEDVAKRLMDYGFHAPTISWPVPGTMMIEPTESESKEELDRFCDAMIAIHGEIKAIEEEKLDRKDNPLKNAPHTAETVTANDWPHPYPRTTAAYPAPWLHTHKFWPPVGRIDNAYGDRNLFCSCVPMETADE